MNSMTDSTVVIQSTSHSISSTPSWFGEVVIIAQYLRRIGVLAKVSERVRFARRRFGEYEVIDFLAVLFGYAVSGERTLEAFYEQVHPFATAFMALFGRDRLPARSTLSRFLAALTTEPVEALRSLFLEDLLERQSDIEQQPCGLTDRTGKLWKVFDIDGTREAARQRALPQTKELPAPHRRLTEVCAPGYTGRKRGEVIRTRTTVWAARIRISGSARLAIQATGSIERNCAEQWKRSSPICKRTSWRIRAHCCGLMVSMEPERFCPTCSGCRLSCAARNMGSWICQLCRPACTCLLINSFPSRKVPWSARSMTVPMSLWGQTGNTAALWWQRIRKAQRSSGLGSNEMS